MILAFFWKKNLWAAEPKVIVRLNDWEQSFAERAGISGGRLRPTSSNQILFKPKHH